MAALRRTQILDAAAQVFAARGFHRTTVRDVAKAAGVADGTIYNCIGAPLARLEGQIAITTLLRRCPDLRLAAAPATLRWRPGLEMNGLKALPVGL